MSAAQFLFPPHRKIVATIKSFSTSSRVRPTWASMLIELDLNCCDEEPIVETTPVDGFDDLFFRSMRDSEQLFMTPEDLESNLTQYGKLQVKSENHFAKNIVPTSLLASNEGTFGQNILKQLASLCEASVNYIN